MIFRYDIGEKLDLTNFRKQFAFYVSHKSSIDYYFVLKDFKIVIEIICPTENFHTVNCSLFDIRREDNEIVEQKVILPLVDSRFSSFVDIQKLFPADHWKATVLSNSVEYSLNLICPVIKIAHKVNNLIAFL
jgi:hypothetical protein